MKSVSSQLSVDDELVYIDGKKIVLPLKAVKEVLCLAHLPHAGITKTYELLRSLYFWPGMYNDAKQLILACGPCTKNAVSLPRIPGLLRLHLLILVLQWLVSELIYLRQQLLITAEIKLACLLYGWDNFL